MSTIHQPRWQRRRWWPPASLPAGSPADLPTVLQQQGTKESPIFTLPNELMLQVTDLLDEEHRAVLSLICRRYRTMLGALMDRAPNPMDHRMKRQKYANKLKEEKRMRTAQRHGVDADLKSYMKALESFEEVDNEHLQHPLMRRFSNKSVGLRYLTLIEADTPDHIICQFCGCLYRWRNFRGKDGAVRFLCPRQGSHPEYWRDRTYPWGFRHCTWGQGLSKSLRLLPTVPKSLVIYPGLVDLILRAGQMGPRFGLPTSFLAGQPKDMDGRGATRKHKARTVNGQLILATQWECESWETDSRLSLHRGWPRELCIHFNMSTWDRSVSYDFQCRNGPKTVRNQLVTLEEISRSRCAAFKCNFCECDFELDIVRTLSDFEIKRKLRLRSWRNYGAGRGMALIKSQMFNQTPATDIDMVTMANRDIHGDFRGDQGERCGATCRCFEGLGLK